MRCLLLVATAAALIAADPQYDSARKKLDLIEASQAPRGSVITFTPAEINAWARKTVPEIIPEGMRDMRVELGTNTASGFAIVDFLKMRQAKGMTTNWLLTKVIEGERPLRVRRARRIVERTLHRLSNARGAIECSREQGGARFPAQYLLPAAVP